MSDAPAVLRPAAGRPRIRLEWITTPVLIAIALLVWHAYVTGMKVSPFILPKPGDVLGAWFELLNTKSTLRHSWATIYETIAGFACALVAGVVMGAVLGKMPWLERTLNPFIVASQVVPKVALVPLFVVWFGFGPTTKILLAAVLAFFPIFTNTLLGVKSVDLGHRDVMTSLNTTRFQRFRHLELPSALPYILTGMEVGIVLAIIGAVVGEYLGGNVGLGYLLIAKMNAYETDMLFAVLIHLTVIGFCFYLLVGMLRRFVIPWHESVQMDGRAR